MEAFLIEPHILAVVKKDHKENTPQEVLKHTEVLLIKTGDALHKVRSLRCGLPSELLMYKLTKLVDAVAAIRLYLEGRRLLQTPDH